MAWQEQDEVKERIRAAMPIDQLVRSYGLTLKPVGRKFKCLCPFHDDHKPSMDVDPQRERYRCWSCGEMGDIFRFVERYEKVEFVTALSLLAERTGIDLVKQTPAQAERSRQRRKQKDYLYRLNEAALHFFRQQLRGPQGQLARDYLERRGISEEMVAEFGLGYAPPGNVLLRHLGHSEPRRRALVAAGLAAWSKRDDNDAYDWFRHRLIFPIRDEIGRLVAFSGRTLGDDVRKYVNTQETQIFHKGRILYNLDRADKAIRRQKQAIVVEGYTDVMMCAQHGVENVVAPMGVEFGDDQARLLRDNQVLLLFDGDDAGIRAAEKRVETCLSQGISCSVAILPEGLDPCDLLVRQGRAALDTALLDAAEGFTFKVTQVLQRFDIRDPIAKSRAADELMRVAARASNPVARDACRRLIAERLDVPESMLRLPGDKPVAPPERRNYRPAFKNSMRTREAPPLPVQRLGEVERLEREAIVFCLHDYQLLSRLFEVRPVEEMADGLVKEIAEVLVTLGSGVEAPQVLARLSEPACAFLEDALGLMQSAGRKLGVQECFEKSISSLELQLVRRRADDGELDGETARSLELKRLERLGPLQVRGRLVELRKRLSNAEKANRANAARQCRERIALYESYLSRHPAGSA